jgi:hypothetical protein
MENSIKVLLPFLLFFIIESNGQTQLGTDIIGGEAEVLGYSCDLSDDGLTMAISSVNLDLPLQRSSFVRVLEYNGNNWVQKGSDILAKVVRYDDFGEDLGISANGNRIAILGKDYIRVYAWDGNDWSELGKEITPQGNEVFLEIELLSNGKSISISKQADQYPWRGEVFVLDWDGYKWIQRGQTLFDQTNSRSFGRHVRYISNGNKLFIYANEGISIYEWNGMQWAKAQNTLVDTTCIGFQNFTCSEDGLTLVAYSNGCYNSSISASGSSQICTYKYMSGNWVQFPSSTSPYPQFTSQISMDISNNGNELVIGMPKFPDPFSAKGRSYLLHRINNNWVVVDSSSFGDQNGDSFGYSMSISGNGQAMAVGAPRSNNYSGFVRAYAIPTLRVAENEIETDSLGVSDKTYSTPITLYPNPASEKLNIKLDSNDTFQCTFKILNLNGKLMQKFNPKEPNSTLDISYLQPGVYIWEFRSNQNRVRDKLILR